VACLGGAATLLPRAAKESIFASFQKTYTGKNIRMLKLGLSVIIRGVDGPYGVAGNVSRVHQAYEIAVLNKNPIPGFTIPRDIPLFHEETWYKCPGCENGFL
jgi:hypothetical protein